MSDEKEYVVYMLKNTANGKYYIGQTCNIEYRKMQHMSHSHNDLIRKDLKEYGADCFVFLILARGLNARQADFVETEMIDLFDAADSDMGYNKQTGGHNGRPNLETRKRQSLAHVGKSPTTEQREKQRISMIGKNKGAKNGMYGTHHSEEWRQKMRERFTGEKNPNYNVGIPVEQIDKATGKVVNTFCCASDASRKLEFSKSHIAECCKGQRKSSNGYMWRYAG